MACTLYIICNGETEKVGTFKDRLAAQRVFALRYSELRAKHGTIPKAVYIEKKGKK